MKRQATVKKLLKLVAFLRKLPDRKFTYRVFVAKRRKDCGTVCCAAGWCPTVFPKALSWSAMWNPVYNDFRHKQVQEFLGLTDNEFGRLFIPGYGYFGYYGYYSQSKLKENATAKQVADHIERCANDLGAGVDITTIEYSGWIEDYAKRFDKQEIIVDKDYTIF